MAELPQEAERLLAVPADEFVAERGRLAHELRAAGRREDAAAVAGMRKPPAVVLAVNRAARDRPQAARDAAAAAERVLATQLSGDGDAYRDATKQLERALDLLADVALAHAAPRGRAASDATSRRVRDLLRAVVSDEDGREALAHGRLTEERESAGFAALAGSLPAGAPAKRATAPKRRAAATAERRERQELQARTKKLRARLEDAERTLRAAERALKQATRERDRAEKTVAALREELEGR
jgi:chromosome segregation ATPase